MHDFFEQIGLNFGYVVLNCYWYITYKFHIDTEKFCFYNTFY